jgi:hypothetical protein
VLNILSRDVFAPRIPISSLYTFTLSVDRKSVNAGIRIVRNGEDGGRRLKNFGAAAFGNEDIERWPHSR